MGSFLLTLGSGIMITYYLELPHTLLILLVGCVVIQGLLSVLDSYKRQPLTYIVIAFGTILVWATIRYYKMPISEMVIDAFEWLKQYDGIAPQNNLYVGICAGSILLVIGIISYVGNQFRPVKISFSIGSAAVLVYMGSMQIQTSQIGVFCLITYMGMVLIECLHIKAYGKVQDESWKVTIGFVPICIVIGLGVIFMPIKEEPLSWQWVVDTYHTVGDLGKELGAELAFRFGGVSDEFGLNFYGVSAESTLGGNIGTSNAIMLTIEPSSKTHYPLYLAGSYMDMYTGRSWACTYNEVSQGIEEYKLNSFELLYGLSKSHLKAIDRTLLKSNEVKITYEKIRTKTLFAPTFMLEVKDVYGKRMPIYTSSSITFPKRQKTDSNYTVRFVEANVESPLFKNKLAELENFTYNENPLLNSDKSYEELLEQFETTACKSFLKEMLITENLLGQLQERSQKIQEVYTALPDGLPERVYVLTKKVTKDCNSKYEQLKAIESYLRQYTYTKEPGNIPENQDFVDYFLFGRKEGYCTYFATAMAVMARTLDIPTRYVEGLYVDYSDHEKGKIYNVRAEKAHAWVEAYFEGIGWLRFEPSAGYTNTAYYTWEENKGTNSQRVSHIEEMQLLEEEQQGMDMTINMIDLKENDYTIEEAEIHSANYGTVIMQIVGLMIAVVIVISGIQIGIYSSKYRKAEPQTQYKMRFKEIMYLLGKEGLKIQAGETLLQLQKRAEDIREERTLVIELIETYSRVRYSKKGARKEQLKKMEELYVDLCNVQNKKYGRIKGYFWRLSYRLYGYKRM